MKMRFVFKRRHIATNEKEAPIELMLYFSRNSTKILPTGIKIFIDQWNEFVVNRPDAALLNRMLSQIKETYSSIEKNMLQDGIEVNLKNFNKYISMKKMKMFRKTLWTSFMMK